MEEKENIKSALSDKMKDLFEQAYSDPELKRELLHNPLAVAKKFGVEFNASEVEQLQKLGGLTDLALEIKTGRLYPRPPSFYPIHVWQIQELLEIISHVLPGTAGPGPIFYPASELGSQTAMFAANAYNPGWVTYPGDNGSGAGGTGSRWVTPGPIFYPAGLRNFIKQRLVQILQVKQR
jgi:hypothetical protein